MHDDAIDRGLEVSGAMSTVVVCLNRRSRLAPDDFSSIRHHALSYPFSMIVL
jgi:hypothetical protein